MTKRGAEYDPKEMSFLDHLEALRWMLIRSGIAVIVGAMIAFPLADWILDTVLVRPLESQFPEMKLIFLRPAGMFLALVGISLWTAVIIALPYISFEIWRFIAPGLIKTERSLMPVVIFTTVFCFLAGASMAYFLVLPYALRFLVGTWSDLVQPQLEIKEYLTFSLRLTMAFGVVFELPVLSFFLARLGIITPAFMRKFRMYAIFLIAVLAAFITPPDAITMLMLLLPLILLYELSIWVAVVGVHRKDRRE
ncbi:MAG: twin-arginine translocase subunit TatC [Candidatus Latescibacteria bacterium]|nr:twin-arginine translocase subunit TatC [Candidatus Latescibacterota bacterium]